jgi:hypothetical protein
MKDICHFLDLEHAMLQRVDSIKSLCRRENGELEGKRNADSIVIDDVLCECPAPDNFKINKSINKMVAH